MKQRDNQWRHDRIGYVTASRFKDPLTRPRSKADAINGVWSATAFRYLIFLLGERLRDEPGDILKTDATDWGNEWEAEAYAAAKPLIEKRYGEPVSEPVDAFAFCTHPTEANIGCSPDGVIGADGLLELKCPYNWINHDLTVAAGTMPKGHTPQVQGSLWVTGRKWYAFGSFDPRLRGKGVDPLFLCRVERDDDYIDNVLAPRLIAFRDWLQTEYEKRIGGDAPF